MCACVHACCNRQGQEHCKFSSLPQRHAEPNALGNTTPNNNKASVLSTCRNALTGISPAPSASSWSTRTAGRDGKGWEHPTPPQRKTAEAGQSLRGAGSCWARGLCGPMGDISPARWEQLLTSPRASHRRGRAEGTEASATACPPAQQHLGMSPVPARTPALGESYSCCLSFCQQARLLGHCPGPPVCPGRGMPGPPMAVPAPGISLLRAGDGHRQPPGFGQTQSP